MLVKPFAKRDHPTPTRPTPTLTYNHHRGCLLSQRMQGRARQGRTMAMARWSWRERITLLISYSSFLICMISFWNILMILICCGFHCSRPAMTRHFGCFHDRRFSFWIYQCQKAIPFDQPGTEDASGFRQGPGGWRGYVVANKRSLVYLSCC